MYGAVASTTVAIMLISMLKSTYILVAILRYDCVDRDVAFHEFWRLRCAKDFSMALSLFSYGVPLFMLMLGFLGWVVFWEHEEARVYSASIVSLISFITMVFFFVRIQSKWWFGWLLLQNIRMWQAKILIEKSIRRITSLILDWKMRITVSDRGLLLSEGVSSSGRYWKVDKFGSIIHFF